MKRKTTVFMPVIAGAICAFLLIGCKSKSEQALNSIDTVAFMVKTEKAAVRNLEEKLLMIGTAKAMDEAVLFPRVPGKLLRNVLKEGDRVRKNEPVAFIERDEVGVVFEPAPVPSTLTGVVGRVYLDVGANVTPQTPVALVVDQSRVRIIVDLPERYLGQIRMNQTAYISVDAYPDARFTGKVAKISPVVSPESRSSPVEVLVDNPDGRLKSGMFAQVEIVVGTRPAAVSVSAAALMEDEEGGKYLFIAGDGKAYRRSVTAGLKTPDFIEIVKGLRPGEEVINFGLFGLKDGSAIEKIQ